jgi:predicted ferric reductase
MAAAGLVYLDNPVVGVGPGMFRFHYREYAEQVGLKVFSKGRQAHSLLPGLAAEHGSLGLFLFTGILLITLRNLMRTHSRWKETRPDLANMAASFVLVLVAYMTTAMFLHLAFVRYFWLMMALASVASRIDADDAVLASTAAQEQS